jgi:hypothetical protein
MKNYRTFSPVIDGVGLSPEEYVQQYPELSEVEALKDMRGIEIIWCWYYASPDSPYVKKGYADREKATQVTDLVFKHVFQNRTYDEGTKKNLRAGVVPTSWSQAIEYFKAVDTGARASAKESIDLMFVKYNEIVEGGAEHFKDKDGNTDFNRYISAMKSIRNELKEIIKERETGFGVTESKIDLKEDETEGSYWCSLYLKTK